MSLSIGYDSGTALSIGVPGTADTSGLMLAITKGALVVAGKGIANGRVALITLGHLVAHGRSTLVQSTAWQYITVTTLGAYQAGKRTLYDGTTGLTPTVGDIWRVPRFSQDGGSVTVFADATFEISQPSIGYDVLPAVEFFSVVNNAWYGPQDFTILQLPLTLPIARGDLNVNGRALARSVDVTRVITRGHLVLIGRTILHARSLDLPRAHLTITGRAVLELRDLRYTLGHLTISGKTITRLSQKFLAITPGHLTVTGRTLTSNRSPAISTAHLTVTGKALTHVQQLPDIVRPIVPGHLFAIGSLLRKDRSIDLTTRGHLVIRGHPFANQVADIRDRRTIRVTFDRKERKRATS